MRLISRPIIIVWSLLSLIPFANAEVQSEFFPSPFEQHRSLKKIHPFKILFLFQEGMDSVHQELLKDAADFVNAKLGQVLKGPILAEVRLERTSNSSGYCERPMCAEAEFPVEYALPCTDADGQLLMTDDTVPGEPTDQVLADNNASYSMVVLLAVHGPDAPDYNCRYFEEMNKNRPLCRWFGPAVMGVVCQWGDFKRPTHARLTFCKKPDEFADNQGELKMVMLHEILHFVIDKMDMDGKKSSWR